MAANRLVGLTPDGLGQKQAEGLFRVRIDRSERGIHLVREPARKLTDGSQTVGLAQRLSLRGADDRVPHPLGATEPNSRHRRERSH
jgi:hypothetical protein